MKKLHEISASVIGEAWTNNLISVPLGSNTILSFKDRWTENEELIDLAMENIVFIKMITYNGKVIVIYETQETD